MFYLNVGCFLFQQNTKTTEKNTHRIDHFYGMSLNMKSIKKRLDRMQYGYMINIGIILSKSSVMGR